MQEPIDPSIAVDVVHTVVGAEFGRECHNMRQAALGELRSWRQRFAVPEDHEVRASYDSLPDQHGRSRSIDVSSANAGSFHLIVGTGRADGGYVDYSYNMDSESSGRLIVAKRTVSGEMTGEPVAIGDDESGLACWADIKDALFDCDKRQSRV